jgi:hypothetical protein
LLGKAGNANFQAQSLDSKIQRSAHAQAAYCTLLMNSVRVQTDGFVSIDITSRDDHLLLTG